MIRLAKYTVSLGLMIVILSAQAKETSLTNPQFPAHPELDSTPGDLCEINQADTHRYPEKIPYCNRNVSSTLKYEVIAQYEAEFGFPLSKQDRKDFKIDHHIPLCMGGSNDIENLWPQHKNVYVLTDPLEGALCEEMAAGKMNQAHAVETIKYAKQYPEEAPGIYQGLRAKK